MPARTHEKTIEVKATVTQEKSEIQFTYLKRVLATIESFIKSIVNNRVVNSTKTTKFLIIRVQDNAIASRVVYSHTIISVAFSRVEIECEEQTSSFKNNYFVILMFAADKALK